MSKFYFILLSIYLILAPYLRLPGFQFYDSKRILQIAIFTLLTLGLLYQWYVQKPRLKNIPVNISLSSPPFLMLAGIFALGFVSVLLSEYVKYALLEYAYSFLLIFFIVILSPTCKKDHYLLGKFIFFVAIIYASLYTIIFIGNYITSYLDPMVILWPNKITYSITIGDTILTGKDILYFSHKRFFNHTQTWSFPILLTAIVYFKNKLKGWLRVEVISLFLLTSIWWVLVFASGGRGTLIAVITSVILIFFIFKESATEFLKVTFTTFVLGIAGYLIFFIYLPVNREAPLLRFSASSRLDYWQKGLELWTKNPLFGVGPMHYSVKGSAPVEAHPHNFLIQFLSEWGILSFILLSGILIIFGLSTLKLRKSSKFILSNNVILIGIYASLIAAILHSLVSGIMHTPMSQVWLVMIVAWIIAWNNQNTQTHISINKITSLLLLLLVTILVLVIPSINDLSNIYSEFMKNHPDSLLWPRFWGQGSIPW